MDCVGLGQRMESSSTLRAAFCVRWAVIGLVLVAGCQEWFNDNADRQVYKLVDQRQRDALGTNHDSRLPRAGREPDLLSPEERDDSKYDLAPHPVDDQIPASFNVVTSQPAAQSSTSQPTTVPAISPAVVTMNRVMTLKESLAYAFRHSREFQTAKEQLYLAALTLTLEKHLWEPRLFSTIRTHYTALQDLTTSSDGSSTSWEPDQALETVAEAGVRQRLPYGGEVTARVVDTLMQDLQQHVVDGQNGQAILDASIPLLRGAGPVARETYYQAERNLIYAVRTFEGFRRNLVVDISGDYLNLQQLRQAIFNNEQSITSFHDVALRSHALWKTGRRINLDVTRAVQDQLFAENSKLSAIERYLTALDQFKIRIGMPIDTQIDVSMPEEPGVDVQAAADRPASELDVMMLMPDVTEEIAVRTALKYRLDLINDFDAIYDAERGVDVAKNSLLPDLRATSSVMFQTNPDVASFVDYNDEQTVWKAGVVLEVPLDRVAERNALRRANILKQQAERNYIDAKETVTSQVRRAMRRVQTQRDALAILIKARDLAIERRLAAKIRMETKGDINNRDVVDAENALLQARNQLAAAQAQFGLAILQFRRDTGTLRIGDEIGQ